MKLFSKIFLVLFLIVSILLLIFIFYRSEIFHSGLKHEYYFKYYLISVVLLLISFLTIFSNDKIRIIFSLSASTFIFSFYLFESYLFLDSREFRVWKSGVNYDKRSEIEYYVSSKKEDVNIKMIVPPVKYFNEKDLSLIPLSGISKSKTILCNEHGYQAIYDSDRYGFNNPDTEWDRSIDFLLVGDSFTQGTCVNREDSIAGILRKISNDSGVITLGYMANGPLIEYATLREYMHLIKPKNIIWLFYENDFWDLKFEIQNKILLNYLRDLNFTQDLSNKQSEIDLLAQSQLDKDEISYNNSFKNNTNYTVKKYIKLFKLRTFIKSISDKELVKKISPEFKEILKLAHKQAKMNGSNFYFVYIPEYKRYKKKLQFDYNFNDYKKAINFIESLKIPIIDLNKEIFQKNDDPLSLYPFRKRAAGFSPEVNVLVTKTIYKNIVNNK